MPSKKTTINRRDFVKLITVLTGGAGLSFPLSSCKGTENPEISDVFDLLRVIQKGLRASPDFLPARADEAVASADAKKIFAFVRDSIRTIPNQIPFELLKNYWDNYRSSELRWGPEGCLRYGAGTFYDKGRLLEKMLNEAGFKAELKSGDFDIESVGWENVFFYDFELAFDPDIPKRVLKTRLEGYSPEEDRVTVLRSDDGEVQSVTRQLLDQLPEDFEFTNPDWTQIAKNMYEVELETEEGKLLLNPNVQNAKFGQSYLSGKPGKVRNNERIRNVDFTLKLGNAEDAYRPVEFIKGKVPVDLLFKNQMILTFQSCLPTREFLTTPRHKIKVLTPMLNLYGTGVSEEEAAKYTFHGKSIHLHGDTVEIEDDSLLLNGEKIEEGKEHPELRERVAAIETSVNASGFPDIELRFSPKDGEGNIIENLDGVDFDLSENRAPFPFRLTENKIRPLRVVLVFDLSTSVPDQFRSGAVEFGGKLVENVQSVYPDAEFLVTRTYSRKAEPVGSWQNDVAEIVKSLEALKQFGDSSSELWHVLHEASTAYGADFVAFFTDGKCTDKLTTKLQIGLKKACPAILLATGENTDAASLGKMAELTGGITKNVFNHEEVIRFVTDFSRDNGHHPYILKYRTRHEGESTRNIQLALKGSKVSATANYEVPDTQENLAPGWSGIYLSIRYNFKEVNKTIAGKKLFGYERYNPVSPEDLADTEAAFFGNYRIKFEGSEPTLSVLLDEWIEARLSQEVFYKALDIGEDETLSALEKGFVTCPDSYLFMQSQFSKSSSNDFTTFQNGVKATIFSERPRGEDGKVMRFVDILPFAQWRTIHKDPKTAFDKTVRHSLRLMQLEAANFPLSTMSVLSGADLELLNRKALDDWLREIWPEDTRDSWLKWKGVLHHLERWAFDAVMLPAKRDKEAYYSVHFNSGTVIAMLESGGAGAAETTARFQRLSEALTAFALVMSALGMGGFIGAWASLEKVKMKWLHKATIAIITMGGMTEEEVNEMIADSACDAAGALAGALGVPFAEAFSTINDLLSLTGHPLVSGCDPGSGE